MNKTAHSNSLLKRPTFLKSLIPLVAIALFLGIGYGVLHLNAEILLIAAALVAGAIAVKPGYNYKEIESGIIESMMKDMPDSIAMVLMTGSSFLLIVISGELFAPAFKRLELAAKNFLVQLKIAVFLWYSCFRKVKQVCSCQARLESIQWIMRPGPLCVIPVLFLL